MQDNDVPIPNKEFTLEQLDDELLLYHPTKTTTVYMNQTASIVWQLCDGKRTVSEITQLLKDSFPESGDELTLDVTKTLDTFSQHGAINTSGGM